MAQHSLLYNARLSTNCEHLLPERTLSVPQEHELQIPIQLSPSESKQRVMKDTYPLHDPKQDVLVSHLKRLPGAIALPLENSGSVARDHLASERTFLAYVRTSLSIALVGVALTQILSLTDAGHEHSMNIGAAFARPLGASAIIVALLTLSIGVVRYFSIQESLVKGRFPVARMGVVLIAASLGALVAIACVLVYLQIRRS